MVEKVVGPKTAKFVLAMIFVDLLGAFIIGSLAINDFFFEVFGPMLAAWFDRPYDADFRTLADPIQFYSTGLLLFLVSRAEKINTLTFLTKIPVIMIFYMTLMAVMQAHEYNTAFHPEVKRYETNPLILLKNMGTFLYLYFGMNSFHQVHSTLKFPTTRRLFKLTSASLTFIWIFATGFASAAYFGLGQGLKHVNLFPDRPGLPGKSDWPNTLLKTILLFSISSSYSVYVIVLKDNLAQFMGGKKLKKSFNLLFTFAVIFSTTTCAWLYKDVTAWIDLVASFAGVILCFSAPALSFVYGYRLRPKFRFKVIFTAIWGVLMTILGMSSTAVLILNKFNFISIDD